jgi:iron complex transport system substrate-binding protein
MMRIRFTRLFRLSLILLATWTVSIIAVPLAAQSAPAKQVISLNLCTDQLLLALAGPDQIVALSPLARDPLLSDMAHEAQAFRTITPRSEILLQLRPDLVLAAPYEHRLTRQILAGHRIEVMTLGGWTSLEAGKAQIRQLAGRLGQSGRGEQLINRIDEAMARVTPVNTPFSVLEIERRLYAPGTQGLVADLVRQWGLGNHADRLGLAQGGFVTLERVLADRPDVLLVTDSSPTAEDMGTALLRHPALNKAFDGKRRIGIPTRLALCGGPQTPALINHLSQALGLARQSP